MPIDCASRRAGSMVSTTTLRPCSAARSARAADVVVLPTPPEPQQTMMSVAAVGEQGVDVEARAAAVGRGPTSGPDAARARGGVVLMPCPARKVGGELVERRRGRCRRAAGAARRSGTSSALIRLRCSSSSVAPLGVLAGLGEQPVDAASSVGVDAGLRRGRRATASRVELAGERRVALVVVERRRGGSG